ncbi:MAG: heavy metal translocating P-type ATPase [Acidobacteriota bacterium]
MYSSSVREVTTMRVVEGGPESPPPVDSGRLELPVLGMNCANCAGAVGKRLQAAGATHVEVSLAAETASFDAVSDDELERFSDEVSDAGYRMILPLEGSDEESVSAERAKVQARERRQLLWGSVFGVPLILLSMGADLGWPEALALWKGESWFGPVLAALGTGVHLILGSGYLLGAWRALRNRFANMDVLIALGSTTAYVYSMVSLILGRGGHLYFEAAAAILVLVKLGKVLEARARTRSSRAIESLLELAPQTASRVDAEGNVSEVPLALVRPGDLVRVRPGERLGVDGTVVEGSSSLDESLLTGESMPVDRGPGDTVFGSTMNGTGNLLIRATGVGRDSALGRIVGLVRRAQGTRAPIQALADRVAAVFVPVLVCIALVTLAVWWWLDGSAESGLVRAVAVLVIACPCALGLATPMAIMAGMGRGAQAGILFRDGGALERAAKVSHLVFDKTGTLTEGRPSLAEIRRLENVLETEVLSLAASVEALSEHPLARAVVEAAQERQCARFEVDEFEVIPGCGATGLVKTSDGDRRVRLGRCSWLESECGPSEEAMRWAEELGRSGQTVVGVCVDGRWTALLGLSDALKIDAPEALQTLRDQGFETAMASGDSRSVAQLVADRLSIDRVAAELLPEDKEELLTALQEEADGGLVAMIGDGINDAPALARADLGMAIGSGAGVALEAADVTLVANELQAVPRALERARATLRVVRQNLFWAFGYNVLLIPVAAGVLAAVPGVPEPLQKLHPGLAAAAMALSSLSVVLNSQRLQFGGRARQEP